MTTIYVNWTQFQSVTQRIITLNNYQVRWERSTGQVTGSNTKIPMLCKALYYSISSSCNKTETAYPSPSFNWGSTYVATPSWANQQLIIDDIDWLAGFASIHLTRGTNSWGFSVSVCM